MDFLSHKMAIKKKAMLYYRAKQSHRTEDWQLYYNLKKGVSEGMSESIFNGFIDANSGNKTKDYGHLSKHSKKDQCIHVDDSACTYK